MIKHLKGLESNSIYDFDNTFSINELYKASTISTSSLKIIAFGLNTLLKRQDNSLTFSQKEINSKILSSSSFSLMHPFISHPLFNYNKND